VKHGSDSFSLFLEESSAGSACGGSLDDGFWEAMVFVLSEGRLACGNKQRCGRVQCKWNCMKVVAPALRLREESAAAWGALLMMRERSNCSDVELCSREAKSKVLVLLGIDFTLLYGELV
jgi:hypothetical protein